MHMRHWDYMHQNKWMRLIPVFGKSFSVAIISVIKISRQSPSLSFQIGSLHAHLNIVAKRRMGFTVLPVRLAESHC